MEVIIIVLGFFGNWEKLGYLQFDQLEFMYKKF